MGYAPYTTTAKQFFEQKVPELIKHAPPVGGVVEFNIEGKDGGTWYIDFDKRSVTTQSVTPACIVRAQSLDFMALVEGRMSAADGILTERLHIAGDAGRIMRLMDAVDAIRKVLVPA